MTILLSNADLRRLLFMPEVIDALERAHRQLAEGEGVIRRRTEAFAPSGSPDALYMLATSDAIAPTAGVAVTRVTSGLYSWPTRSGTRRRQRDATSDVANPSRSMRMVFLFSTTTGEPLAMMPGGGILSVVRLGATNALGARYLARDPSSVVAVLGCGPQAGGQLAGFCAVRSVDRVRCYSPTAERREAFARAWSDRLGISVTATATPEDAVRDADAVLCATNTIEAVYRKDWIEPGVHLSSIRGPEIEPAALRRVDRLVVYSREALPDQLASAGVEVPAQHSEEDLSASGLDLAALPQLTDLLCGRVPGRQSPEEVTAFLNPVGTAFQFATVANVVYRRALEQGLGRDLPTEWFTE